MGAALPAARALDAVSQSGSVASQVLDRTSASASRTSQHIADMDAGAPGFALARNFNVLSSAAAGLGVVVAGTATAMFSAARQSQQWEAQLTTATRSTVLANAAQEELTTTANKLGLTVNSTIAAFVRLKNLGLDPGRQAILAYSNVAAGMGTDVQQFIEAVADAATFEFERLKEFGIKASQEGDRVRFTFQGVTTEVEKSARAIERYLQGIGLEQFAGSLERQSKTIDGSLGRINSQFDQFWQNLNDRTGSGEAFARMLDRIARGAEEVNKRLFKPQDADLFGQRLELQLRLQDLQAQESDGRFGFQAGRLKQIQEITAEIGRIDAALSGVLSTQQRQATAAHSAWEETHRQREEAERLRLAQEAALAAKERAAKMEKVGSAIDAMFEREARASAAASEQFADSLERIKRAADPAYASTQQLAGALSVLEQARAMGPVNGGISEEEFVSLSAAIKDLYTGTTAAKAAHEKWLAAIQDSIDPMRRFEREAKKVREAFSKGELGDTTASQVEEYLERLRKQAQGTGDALKDAFNAPGKAINEFAEGTGKAVGSLREMFKEGDSGYKALTIGLNALNAMQAINAVLNQSAGDPYTAFARMATMAATVAALGYSVGMGGGGSDRTAANRQAEQGAGSVLGDATAKTESIARATEITADATTALVGLNRSMLVALQGLQAGIAGAVTRIARGAGDVEFDVPGGWSSSQQRLAGAAVIAPGALAGTAFQSLQLGSAVGSTILGPIGAVAGALGGKEIVDRTLKVLDKATLGALSAVGKLIGGSSKQVDEGITVVCGTLAELIDETMVSAYATIKSK
ncbi:MAG: hypothetical protein LPK85_00420, partial [Gammaproteobacteria bacterium]|nr:hypothetical protein [Gammaproteobacteria bacterium]